MKTDLDALFIGNFYLQKSHQNPTLIKELRAELLLLDD
jgi:hypothetical protein